MLLKMNISKTEWWISITKDKGLLEPSVVKATRSVPRRVWGSNSSFLSDYNKITADIVKNSSFIAVQNENIKSWIKNKQLSHSIQLNAPRKLLEKIEQKCQQENIKFVKVSKFYPSTQICSNCQKRNENLKGLKNLGIRDWDCPHCHTHHDRDCNAAINILNKGLEIVGTTVQ